MYTELRLERFGFEHTFDYLRRLYAMRSNGVIIILVNILVFGKAFTNMVISELNCIHGGCEEHKCPSATWEGHQKGLWF